MAKSRCPLHHSLPPGTTPNPGTFYTNLEFWLKWCSVRMQTALWFSVEFLPIYLESLLGMEKKMGGVGKPSGLQGFIPAAEILNLKEFLQGTASDVDLKETNLVCWALGSRSPRFYPKLSPLNLKQIVFCFTMLFPKAPFSDTKAGKQCPKLWNSFI